MNPLTINSEDQLFSLFQQGSDAAFSLLYERFLDPLFTRAYYTLKDVDEARDIAQEVLVYVWNHRTSLEITTGIKPYLMGAVQQKCADRIRKNINREKRQHIYASLATTITGTSPLETKELSNRLYAAMELISPASRRAFILLYIEKRSLKEIADLMNIKVQSVKNHISQALKVLRENLQKN